MTYILNERALSAIHPLPEELSFDPTKPYLFDLSYLGALTVSGENAKTFLQGQITCDMTQVTPAQMRAGALCNLQGRIMALMDVIAWQEIQLILPQDLLAATQASLAKAALFSRVTLTQHLNFSMLGLYQPHAQTTVDFGFPLPKVAWQVTQSDQHLAYALSDDLIVILVKSELKQTLLTTVPVDQQRGSLAWHDRQLHIPHMTIYPNTRGLFLPHRLGLQHTPYLSFDKGCYKGQEIIARTQYRAKIKHELNAYQLDSDEPIFAGQKIYADSKTGDIGEVIDYCPLGGNGYYALISLLIDHPQQVYFEHHQTSLSLKKS